MPSHQGPGLDCFELLRRDDTLRFQTCIQTITASVVVEQLKALSLSVSWKTVFLDKARVHPAKVVQACCLVWEQRGLTSFFLSPHSPHLNLAETQWGKLKYEWLTPRDYLPFDHLRDATGLTLVAIGSRLTIAFSKPHYGRDYFCGDTLLRPAINADPANRATPGGRGRGLCGGRQG